MTAETVAVYWDFENIHAGIYDKKKGSGSYGKAANRSKQQDVLVDVSALYEFSASFGNIAINKAYGNWQWFAKYRQVLLKCAIELVQIFPPGASAKNGTDIKLSLDAVEDVLRFPHISSIIVIGGDSDFIPLAQKIKASGKQLIGVGCKDSTNRHWANNCSEFKYYDTLFVETGAKDEGEDNDVVVKDAVELITRAVNQITARTGEDWAVKASVRHVVKRLDPTFDEANYKCKTFSDLLKKHSKKFKVKKGEHDHIISLMG